MKIVLDTNILVSGLLNPHGAPSRVLDLITQGEIVLLFDDRILSEYREVLARPRFKFNPDDVKTLLDFFITEGERVASTPLSIVLPDLDDFPFLEVAILGNAKFIVTGNANHFISSKGKHLAQVVSPAEFISHWLKEK